MRIFSIIILLFIPLTFLGQEINNGVFCANEYYVGWCLTFQNDNDVEYEYWSCTSGFKMTGKYKIRNRKLILKCKSENDEKISRFKYDIIEIDDDYLTLKTKIEGDEYILDFKIKD